MFGRFHRKKGRGQAWSGALSRTEPKNMTGRGHNESVLEYDVSPTRPLRLPSLSSCSDTTAIKSTGDGYVRRNRDAKCEYSESLSLTTYATDDSYHTASSKGVSILSQSTKLRPLSQRIAPLMEMDPVETPVVQKNDAADCRKFDMLDQITPKAVNYTNGIPTMDLHRSSVENTTGLLSGLGISGLEGEGAVSDTKVAEMQQPRDCCTESHYSTKNQKEQDSVSDARENSYMKGLQRRQTIPSKENVAAAHRKTPERRPEWRSSGHISARRSVDHATSSSGTDPFSHRDDGTHRTVMSDSGSEGLAMHPPPADMVANTPPQVENLTYLFIVSIHAFDSQILENKEDATICLSFEKNELAFVHTVDESGWGEVTLVKSGRRGWVPFNYFADVVREDNSFKLNSTDSTGMDRRPLEKLLSNAAQFLLESQSVDPQQDIKALLRDINGIRDGVKQLLEDTNCVSRSNELVKAKSPIRSCRKKVLAEWYNLMLKADHYKRSMNSQRVELLQQMVYTVLWRSFDFYNTWVKEKLHDFSRSTTQSSVREYPTSAAFETMREDASYATGASVGDHTTSRSDHLIQHLSTPPHAVARLDEVHGLLFTYIALILGRLDMIEHNAAGCEVLELIVHQIILLLRELLYISKACSLLIHAKFSNAYENNLDHNLDPLLSLVSELVACVKVFVTDTINETYDNNKLIVQDEVYCYTSEGEHLIVIIAKMTRLISSAINGCKSYLKLIGDFQLGNDRKYPDFERMKMTPDQFIQKCSKGIIMSLNQNDDLHTLMETNKEMLVSSPSFSKKLVRFSTIRSGINRGSLSVNGTQFLQEIMPDSVPFQKEPVFTRFSVDESIAVEDDIDVINNRAAMKEEMLYDKGDNLIGASFRAVIFMLTDEKDLDDGFLLATFLLNFKSFGTSVDLVEALIARFDVTDRSARLEVEDNSGKYSSRFSRLKQRRRKVCKIFQKWMESFWDYEKDYILLATIVNFFNEAVSVKLPTEARLLIETAAKLSCFTPSTNSVAKKERLQLNPILLAPQGGLVPSPSYSSRLSVVSVDEKFIEEYELTQLSSSSRSSISIPQPLVNLGSASLMTRKNLTDIRSLLLEYDSLVPQRSECLYGGSPQKSKLAAIIAKWENLVFEHNKQSIFENFSQTTLNIAELNPIEVAKQLTLVESVMYLAIKPVELLTGDLCDRKRTDESSKARTILNFTNFLSQYVTESIIGPGFQLEARVDRLRGWLKIALSALYFRNFNSVASIMTALQSHAISRLSFIWESLDERDRDLFTYLSKIIHPNNNYKVYRIKLNKLAEDFVPTSLPTAKSPLPVVPFFNLFIQDLTFINEGNCKFRNPSSFKPHKIVNIDKYFRITRTVSMLQYFQVPYDTEYKSDNDEQDHFFNVSNELNDSISIVPLPLLQTLILYEFWRISTLYSRDGDRAYNLSTGLKPATN
ncbi:AFR630Cp [Eremothecium gossypii ATCC 10895]|uniref:AFR630Cp n=1 Tax=Eremothecium gossypii (strain ATCC 10895 / CBS 109.51 / FGSC 9923 / NRRL Y-1056) TaxID=284811 RepID=Q752E6_EREGS|nr:AFR630Cp [Eremothecium gossypii ATCC 10895]AAS54001.2 AFR630Cp [Eremothecium gossypii ATCC 10895]AEY98315.1 FAFR630Cp [Eremothecium gossypii FDAG1]